MRTTVMMVARARGPLSARVGARSIVVVTMARSPWRNGVGWRRAPEAQRTESSVETPDAPPSYGRGGSTFGCGTMRPVLETGAAFAFFTRHEAETVAAAAARIFPTDELGPGATEAGVVY